MPVHDVSRLHPKHADPTVPMDGRRRSVAMVVLCFCILTTTIDVTITNVALPFIGRELDASVSGLHDTYTTRSGATVVTAERKRSSLPARGGSRMMTSACSPALAMLCRKSLASAV